MVCSGHSQDHSHEDETLTSLHDYIALDSTYCLNELVPNSGRSVFKTHVDRFSENPSVISDTDPDDYDDETEKSELLFHVTFTEAVSIHSLAISGKASVYIPPDGNENNVTSAPCSVKIFVNRIDLDLESARDLSGDLTLQLLPPEHVAEVSNQNDQDVLGNGTLDYPLRPGGKFKYTSSMTLYFGENFAQQLNGRLVPTEITYIGFKGIGTKMKRQAVRAVYETMGMKKDHKVPEGEYSARNFL